MGRPDKKREDLTTNGMTRQQTGRPDNKWDDLTKKWDDQTTNGMT
jgi:hypothetical protein